MRVDEDIIIQEDVHGVRRSRKKGDLMIVEEEGPEGRRELRKDVC